MLTLVIALTYCFSLFFFLEFISNFIKYFLKYLPIFCFLFFPHCNLALSFTNIQSPIVLKTTVNSLFFSLLSCFIPIPYIFSLCCLLFEYSTVYCYNLKRVRCIIAKTWQWDCPSEWAVLERASLLVVWGSMGGHDWALKQGNMRRCRVSYTAAAWWDFEGEMERVFNLRISERRDGSYL